MDKFINFKLTVISVLILVVIFFLYSQSFKNDVPNCEGYVANVYLYVLLALLILSFSVLFIEKRRIPITGVKSLLFFGVSIISLIALLATDAKNPLLTHLLWVAFIISLSASVYTIWLKHRGTGTSTLIGALFIMGILTVIAHIRPEWVKLSWGTGLTMALFVGLLALIIPPLVSDVGHAYYRVLSGLFVILFGVLILYDTKILRVKAATCTYPNYPADSVGLFLDGLNMYSNLAVLRG